MARYAVEVREVRPAPGVGEDQVLTLTEAARRLGLSQQAVGTMVATGKLTRYIDGEENNPTKANRVLVSDVARLNAERRRNSGDGRLKRRGRM